MHPHNVTSGIYISGSHSLRTSPGIGISHGSPGGVIRGPIVDQQFIEELSPGVSSLQPCMVIGWALSHVMAFEVGMFPCDGGILRPSASARGLRIGSGKLDFAEQHIEVFLRSNNRWNHGDFTR